MVFYSLLVVRVVTQEVEHAQLENLSLPVDVKDNYWLTLNRKYGIIVQVLG